MTTVSIGDIASLKYGKMPPADVITEEGYPIFSGYRVTGFAKEYTHQDRMLVVVARGVGGTGDVKISPPESWITNLSIVLDLNVAKVDRDYLFYKLQTERLKDRLDTGAAQSQITIANLAPYKINIHDLHSQRLIAATLRSYDDLIANNKRRIELLEQSARLLYREWFVRLKYPGHEHDKVVDGAPEGWEHLPLGDLFTLQRGFDLPIQYRKTGQVPIYASTGITGYHDVAKVPGPGLVTGRSGSLGQVLYVSKDYWPLNTTLWVKEFMRVGVLYAKHLLESLSLEKFNGGAAVPTLNRNDVHRIRVLCPPEPLHNQFEAVTEPVDCQIECLQLYNAKLAKARDLLLPRLLDGRISV